MEAHTYSHGWVIGLAHTVVSEHTHASAWVVVHDPHGCVGMNAGHQGQGILALLVLNMGEASWARGQSGAMVPLWSDAAAWFGSSPFFTFNGIVLANDPTKI